MDGVAAWSVYSDSNLPTTVRRGSEAASTRLRRQSLLQTRPLPAPRDATEQFYVLALSEIKRQYNTRSKVKPTKSHKIRRKLPHQSKQAFFLFVLFFSRY